MPSMSVWLTDTNYMELIRRRNEENKPVSSEVNSALNKYFGFEKDDEK